MGWCVSQGATDAAFYAHALTTSSRTSPSPEDSADAVAYCALATGQGRDHDFMYRARTAEGRTVLLHDVVHVIKSPLGLAARLRGIMVPVEEDA